MKNAFYFILKALSFSRYFIFCHKFFGHVGKTAWLEKIRLTLKFMTSHPGLETIAIHILPNISQSKSN